MGKYDENIILYEFLIVDYGPCASFLFFIVTPVIWALTLFGIQHADKNIE